MAPRWPSEHLTGSSARITLTQTGRYARGARSKGRGFLPRAYAPRRRVWRQGEPCAARRAARGAGSCRRWTSAARRGNTHAWAPCSRSVPCGKTRSKRRRRESPGSFLTTNSATTSPESGSGCATAATSSTPGCSAATLSTSLGYTLKPDTRIMSFLRSSMYRRSRAYFGVDMADIAGTQPIAEHHLLGFVGTVPIAPRMTCGPNTQISPMALVGTSRPSSSRIDTSVDGIGRPTAAVEIQVVRIGGGHRGIGSWVTPHPVGYHATRECFPAFRDDRLHGHAAGERHPQRTENRPHAKPGVCISAFEGGC